MERKNGNILTFKSADAKRKKFQGTPIAWRTLSLVTTTIAVVGLVLVTGRPPSPPKAAREGVSYVFSGGGWLLVGPEGIHAHAEDVMRPACEACRRLRGVEGEQAAFRVLRYLDEQHRQQRASVAPESSQ